MASEAGTQTLELPVGNVSYSVISERYDTIESQVTLAAGGKVALIIDQTDPVKALISKPRRPNIIVP